MTSQLSADTLAQMERGHNIFAYIHYMTPVVDRHKHATSNKGQVLAVDHWLCRVVALPHDNLLYELSPMLMLACIAWIELYLSPNMCMPACYYHNAIYLNAVFGWEIGMKLKDFYLVSSLEAGTLYSWFSYADQSDGNQPSKGSSHILFDMYWVVST